MKAAGAPVELFMYEHCGHAFMNALTQGGREKIKGEQAAVQLQVVLSDLCVCMYHACGCVVCGLLQRLAGLRAPCSRCYPKHMCNWLLAEWP